MFMEPKYALIGCGSISPFHFNGLRKVGGKIVRVVDIDVAKASRMAEPFGAKVGADFREALADPEVTVVSVLTTAKFHPEMCLAALDAGKDVICEKTLGRTVEDALTIVKAAKASKQLFFTAYMKRFFPAVVKAKELLPSLGKLFSVHARTWQCWGDMYNMHDPSKLDYVTENHGSPSLKCCGSHIIDGLLNLLGRPKSVYGKVDYIGGSDVADRKAIALLEYEGSLVVSFEAATHPLKKIGFERNSWDERIEINGTEGRIDLLTPMWDHSDRNSARLIHYSNATMTSTEYCFDAVTPFDFEVAYFHECLMRREQGRPDVVDGLCVDVVIDGIQQSHRQRRAIDLDYRGY